MTVVTLDKLTYQEHTEKQLRDALGLLVQPWTLDGYPDAADVVLDGIVEALHLRKQTKFCTECAKGRK